MLFSTLARGSGSLWCSLGCSKEMDNTRTERKCERLLLSQAARVFSSHRSSGPEPSS